MAVARVLDPPVEPPVLVRTEAGGALILTTFHGLTRRRPTQIVLLWETSILVGRTIHYRAFSTSQGEAREAHATATHWWRHQVPA